MSLSIDCQYLVTGDQTGGIHVWNLTIVEDDNNKSLMKTFDIHSGEGQIKNLVPLAHPMSVYGLTDEAV